TVGISEIGISDGEFFAFSGEFSVGYNLYFTDNYGINFITIPIDTTVALHSISGHSPQIYRGAESGELYLTSWTPELHYKIFYSVDTGYTWEEKYESDFINIYYWGVDFTAGRKSGSFYVTRKTLDQIWYHEHIDLYIDYSEDYGETFTTYFHELDEYFPEGNYHNDILSFNFNDFEPPVIGEILEETNSIKLNVTQGTDLTELVPIITISEKATVYPLSGVANNFTDTVIYSVTAQNGDEKGYKVIVLDTITTVQKLTMQKTAFSVFPNPTNEITTIRYKIQKPSKIRISIYNLQGRLVNTLVNENKSSGEYEIKWNGLSYNGNIVENGLYIIYLQTTLNIYAQRLLIIK
ncbi:MAG: T9SS type A sorting domain-containing protein, partial [Chlorobi bacterium]|nr:T9SS type A sorting domain-containing protein [Chlorobiota bacterium]